MKEIQILNNGDTLNAIRTKINENFQLTREEIESGTTDPLAKFGVNEGNETDGVADLLNIEEGTLSFKVGGEYPNLVTTSGDGVTSEIESINPLHLQNLADGEYTVVVNGQESNITDAEFYSQLLEPENPNNGDVWFNGESALKLEKGGINVELMPNTNFTPSFFVKNDDIYLAGGQGYRILRSIDGGVTWGLITYDSEADNNTLVGGVYHNGAFYFVGTNKRVYKTETSTGWLYEELTTQNVNITKFKKLRDNFFVVLTAEGIFFYSTDMVNWNSYRSLSEKSIVDMVYMNNTYYAFLATGEVYTSTDISNWAINETTITSPSYAFAYQNYILVGNQTGGITLYDPTNKTTEFIQLQNSGKINHFHLRQDGGLLVLGSYNICSVTYDLKDFTQIYETGGNLTYGDDNFIIGASGILLKTTSSPAWVQYSYIPVGEVIISGGEVTYFTTYPYNSNGLHEASSSTFGLLRTAAVTDELDCNCNDAVITPANLYDLSNYRMSNTTYEVDQKVGCPYHHNLQLKCIQAGTTSNEGLNTRGLLEAGTTIEDGTVVWEVEELGTGAGGGSGFNLFDTKISDHILEGDEALGWALQGTYVNKTDYPDFYNKCLEEYQNESNINSYLSSNINYVGTITNNQGILSGFTRTDYAKTNIPMTPDSNVWEINLEITTGNDISTKQIVFGGSDNNIRSFHIGLQDTHWNIDIGSGASWIATTVTNQIVAQANTKYLLKATFDGASYVLNGSIDDGLTWVEFAKYESTTPIANMVETKLGVGRDNGSPFYGLINLNCCNITINNALFWQGVNSIEQNPNGHKFYSISQKSLIDSVYEQYGIANFYGIDEENERIFLPRNLAHTYFRTEENEENFIAPDYTNAKSLPSGSEVPDNGWIVTTLACNSGYLAVYINGVHVGRCGPSANTEVPFGAYTVKKGDIVSGTTVTFFPADTVKVVTEKEACYFYYCVGNTQVTSAVINVTEITTSENDTIPLFTGMYFDFKPNNPSWLKAGEQQNSGGIYTSCYNTLVDIVNGVNPYSINVINIEDMVAGVDYSTYWKLDQDNLVFQMPIRTNERILVSKKEQTADDPTWYNLYSDGWLEQGGKALASADGEVLLTKPYKDTSYTITSSCSLVESGSFSTGMDIRPTEITQSGFKYHMWNNKGVGAYGNNYWQASGYTEIPTISEYTENVNLYFKVANAVQNLELLDAGEVMEAVADKISRQDCKAYITETYVNGTSWYRVYSDGWCEQGGRTVSDAVAPQTVTFLKSFKDLNYNSLAGIGGTGSVNNNSFVISTLYKTTTSMVIENYNSGTGANNYYEWVAKGYIK